MTFVGKGHCYQVGNQKKSNARQGVKKDKMFNVAVVFHSGAEQMRILLNGRFFLKFHPVGCHSKGIHGLDQGSGHTDCL